MEEEGQDGFVMGMVVGMIGVNAAAADVVVVEGGVVHFWMEVVVVASRRQKALAKGVV